MGSFATKYRGYVINEFVHRKVRRLMGCTYINQSMVEGTKCWESNKVCWESNKVNTLFQLEVAKMILVVPLFQLIGNDRLI
jgi:hypothetical protein